MRKGWKFAGTCMVWKPNRWRGCLGNSSIQPCNFCRKTYIRLMAIHAHVMVTSDVTVRHRADGWVIGEGVDWGENIDEYDIERTLPRQTRPQWQNTLAWRKRLASWAPFYFCSRQMMLSIRCRFRFLYYQYIKMGLICLYIIFAKSCLVIDIWRAA